ncbi:hypothetical protein D0Z00_004230 [Geotrichum galactomycetum]|uniref:Uncharacterized protein n=1 Tax=Geotrichum galactomycetum TaxID=27317 RepID=A0ACB6UYZ6_9ASCO|nr:hypothetical protein D0Z00_004230 [Geotrichum candidum]
MSFKERETNDNVNPASTSHIQNHHHTHVQQQQQANLPQYIATPGGGRRQILPPVASISSPQSLLAVGSNTPNPSWVNSLRSGPLSPAMLQGPQPVQTATHLLHPSSDTVGAANGSSAAAITTAAVPSNITITGSAASDHARPGPLSPFIPSISRGILTPDSSSLFNTPGPATAAILNLNSEQLRLIGSTGLTPLGLTATASTASTLNITVTAPAGPVVVNPAVTTRKENKIQQQPQQQPQQQQANQQGVFGPTDPTDAANSLYLLSRSSNGKEPSLGDKRQREAAPAAKPAKQLKTKNSTATGGKKGKGKAAANATIITNGTAIKKEQMEPVPVKAMEETSSSGSAPGSRKKLTDEEKRKSFLERNRVAALKCRQRKKQWLENLQARVEYYSVENESLTAQVASLREQLQGVKNILLQHKDCPNLGLSQEAFAAILSNEVVVTVPPQPQQQQQQVPSQQQPPMPQQPPQQSSQQPSQHQQQQPPQQLVDAPALTHPQLKEEEFAEVLIENQRGWFLFGFPFFSANTLFPLDPSPWTCGPAGATTAPGDISSFPLPAPGWEWAWSRWYIDMGYDVDDQGWSYSFNFGSNSRWHGSHVWFHSFVRRRRWIRLRRRQLPVATDGDGTPISLPSGGAPSAAPKYYMSPMRYFPVPRAQLRREEEAANEARSMVLDFSGDGGCSSDMAIEQLLCRLRGARLDRERTAIVMRFFGLSSSAACSHAAIKVIPPISTVDAEVLVEDAEFVRQLIDTFTYLDSKNQLVSLLSAEALRLTSQPPALDSRDTNNDDDDYDDDGKSFADLQTNISEAELMEPPSNATTVPAPQTPTVDSRRALVLEKLAKTCANLVKQEQYYNED